MGNVIIKKENEYYLKDKDIRQLLDYIAGNNGHKKKARYCNGRGVSKDPKKASEMMIAVQRYYGKNNKRRLCQFFVSFSGTVKDVNSVKLVADSLSDLFFENYQVYYGIHTDTDNLHIHFAVNVVSYINGKKMHQSKAEFDAFKKKMASRANKVLSENGYDC